MDLEDENNSQHREVYTLSNDSNEKTIDPTLTNTYTTITTSSRNGQLCVANGILQGELKYNIKIGYTR